jgi:hypothetical protein
VAFIVIGASLLYIASTKDMHVSASTLLTVQVRDPSTRTDVANPPLVLAQLANSISPD